MDDTATIHIDNNNAIPLYDVNIVGGDGDIMSPLTKPHAEHNMGCEKELAANGRDVPASKHALVWGVDDNPPWYETPILGFQHFLAMYMGALAVPMITAEGVCMDRDNAGKAQLLNTSVFVCGLATILQATIGVRLPIVQVDTVSILAAVMSFLSLPSNVCPAIGNSSGIVGENVTMMDVGSPEHRAIWQGRLAEIQGSIMVASLMEILLGGLGIIGFLMRFIGPLSIAPTIALVGLSLCKTAAVMASSQWWIAIFTLFLMIVFSQYLKEINIPCAGYNSEKKCHITWFPMFKLFPVLLSVLFAWLLCFSLTVSGVLPSSPGEAGYEARTDVKLHVIGDSAWFWVPYPGQWGLPRVSVSLVIGLMAGLMASIIESVGDYMACARVAGVPRPPNYAINRGIMVEGFGVMLGGLFGSGNGVTSSSTNIGIIGLTKVASRRVVVAAGILMLMFGVMGKFGALFVTIPDPIIGALFFIFFGMIVAVGISSLQTVDMNSSRNQFVFGFSFFFGLALPGWVQSNPGAIQTGVAELDGILSVLLGTNMFVGGLLGFFLDNTIPGTLRERGMVRQRDAAVEKGNTITTEDETRKIYSISFVNKCLNRYGWTRWLPICPGKCSTLED